MTAVAAEADSCYFAKLRFVLPDPCGRKVTGCRIRYMGPNWKNRPQTSEWKEYAQSELDMIEACGPCGGGAGVVVARSNQCVPPLTAGGEVAGGALGWRRELARWTRVLFSGVFWRPPLMVREDSGCLCDAPPRPSQCPSRGRPHRRTNSEPTILTLATAPRALTLGRMRQGAAGSPDQS